MTELGDYPIDRLARGIAWAVAEASPVPPEACTLRKGGMRACVKLYARARGEGRVAGKRYRQAIQASDTGE